MPYSYALFLDYKDRSDTRCQWGPVRKFSAIGPLITLETAGFGVTESLAENKLMTKAVRQYGLYFLIGITLVVRLSFLAFAADAPYSRSRYGGVLQL
jgi:hypothetical protein